MDRSPVAAERRRRFFAPAHALHACGAAAWHACGVADTPAADAVCELYLTVEADLVSRAAFTLYGPPVAIVCADWLCETLTGRTIAFARGLPVQDLEHALALAPDERYGALLAMDALANALANLGS